MLADLYQVSRISRETRAFLIHLPLTRRITKVSRISSTKFDQLIPSKMVEIVATRCHILRLTCTKFDFGTPLGSSRTALPQNSAGFKGSFEGRKGEGGRAGKEREEKGKAGEKRGQGRERREGEWRG